MGGIADYSGSRVCEMPLEEAAQVAVQDSSDARVHVHSRQTGGSVHVAVEALQTEDPLRVRELLVGPDRWARYVVGVIWWLGKRRGAWRGVNLLLDSDVPLGAGVSSSAAVEVATMRAVAALHGVELAPMELAAACQQVENRVVGAPCGVMDQVACCLGQPHAMLEIRCQPDSTGMPAELMGSVAVPSGYRVVGLDSGVQHEVSGDPYTHTRTAAFMGQRILETLGCDGGGFLANVDPERYRAELSHHLPDQIDGESFLDGFGAHHDPVTDIGRATSYHVRAATDHHVFEAARVLEFLACMKRGDEPAVCWAGQLMYASHASYTVAARLGHPLTDRLVADIRREGQAGGLLGAKITGGGGGGTVAVLMRDTAGAMAALHGIASRYEADTGRQTRLFLGSSPGAASVVPLRLQPQELTSWA